METRHRYQCTVTGCRTRIPHAGTCETHGAVIYDPDDAEPCPRFYVDGYRLTLGAWIESRDERAA